MKTKSPLSAAVAVLLLSAAVSPGAIKVVVEYRDTDTATPDFTFKTIPRPAKNDAATQAEFVLVDGVRGIHSGDLGKLHDGKLPTDEDAPEENFYFVAGTDGGRLLVDLRSIISLKQVNTYSWHSGPRGPQVYTLYGSDGRPASFNAQPKQGLEPDKCGWHLLARVDTRTKQGLAGGQYGVSISDSAGVMGTYRYLLFVISRTENQDEFGNTFYSEIDVVDSKAPEPAQPIAAAPLRSDLRQPFTSGGGAYQITIDAARAPDLAQWAFKELAPVTQEWYPKLVQLLPSQGYQAPAKVTIDFGESTAGYVAITRGNRITCTTSWFRENLHGEAKGCVVHELVHVVQQYGGSPSVPYWLGEGIPDYIRWFIYEPQSHGADVVWIRQQKNLTPSYDGSYRISANFLNWATEKYDKQLVPRLNVALRQGHYNEALWKQLTGHPVATLGADWKKWLEAGAKAD